MENPEHLSTSVQNFISSTIIDELREEPFYVVDLLDILKKHKNWLLNLPRVKPFYAVKCNDSPVVLELLASLGTGFDCASKAEIDTVLSMNVQPSDIVYANPCKSKSHMMHAVANGVDLMTFDNEQELRKISHLCPQVRLILRIKVDDSGAVCQFSAKFGADVDKSVHLLRVARKLGLTVIGVSFHVGSGCKDPVAYSGAIRNARYVFDVGREMGYDMRVLDLGGGYPGASNAPVTFEEIANVINISLDEHFPVELEPSVSIIAEPGRYYVASAFTLATNIIAKRMIHGGSGDFGSEQRAMYYLNDGVYGSFNCTIFDHYIVEPLPFFVNGGQIGTVELTPTEPVKLTGKFIDEQRSCHLTTMWGPTCDSMDCIKRDFTFAEMNIGEWVIFPNMGAYTISASSTFNGFQKPMLKCLMSPYDIEMLRKLSRWPKIARQMHQKILNDIDIDDIDEYVETEFFNPLIQVV